MYFPCILNLITKQVLTSILFIYLFHWSACLNNLVVVSVPTYWRNAISVNTLDSIKQFVSCAVRFTYFSTIFNVLYVTATFAFFCEPRVRIQAISPGNASTMMIPFARSDGRYITVKTVGPLPSDLCYNQLLENTGYLLDRRYWEKILNCSMIVYTYCGLQSQ